MRKLAIACCAGALSVAAAATAHESVYLATLSAAAESPPIDSSGVGSAIVTINFDLFTMRVEANFSGLTGNVTAAHIHGLTVEAEEGIADVLTSVPSFPGFPTGVLAGEYDETLDLTQASSYNPAFITASGGTISLASNALFAGLNAGKTYLNIHTTEHQGGEIRGFLLPTPKADFNHDGVVDGADLDTWTEAYGITEEGDANDDDLSAGDDFLIWQNQLGFVAGVSEDGHHRAFSVTEPANGLAAAAVAACFAVYLARRPAIRWRPVPRNHPKAQYLPHIFPGNLVASPLTIGDDNGRRVAIPRIGSITQQCSTLRDGRSCVPPRWGRSVFVLGR